jgi:hypothetical protein
LELFATMEPSQHPPIPPVEFRPSLHDRIVHWSGWEQLAEYSRPIIAGVILILICLWLVGWWVARSSTSSVASALRAEALVQRLQSPGASPKTPEIPVEEARKRLEALVPVGSALDTRFAGVLAEEEVLQRVSPITVDRFTVAVHNLQHASLPVDASLTTATELTKEGKADAALQALNSITEDKETQFPLARAYALLQRAVLLRDQHVSNADVIDELQALLLTSPAAGEAADRWFSGNSFESISALRS